MLIGRADTSKMLAPAINWTYLHRRNSRTKRTELGLRRRNPDEENELQFALSELPTKRIELVCAVGTPRRRELNLVCTVGTLDEENWTLFALSELPDEENWTWFASSEPLTKRTELGLHHRNSRRGEIILRCGFFFFHKIKPLRFALCWFNICYKKFYKNNLTSIPYLFS